MIEQFWSLANQQELSTCSGGAAGTIPAALADAGRPKAVSREGEHLQLFLPQPCLPGQTQPDIAGLPARPSGRDAAGMATHVPSFIAP